MDINIIEQSSMLNGKTIEFAGFMHDRFVLITSDKKAFVIECDYDLSDDDYTVTPCSNGRVFNILRTADRLRDTFKKHEVFDWNEYVAVMEREREIKKEIQERNRVEQEKRLLAELKAKYEDQ